MNENLNSAELWKYTTKCGYSNVSKRMTNSLSAAEENPDGE